MLTELILGLLCLVAFLIFIWDMTLQLRLKRIEKKLKVLEEKKKVER